MSAWVILGIAVGLAMDCFAVAIATGLSLKRLHLRHALKMALFFGGFQAAMPVAGWLAGNCLRGLLAGVDHWVAFALLTAIGAKMIWESRQVEREERADPVHTGRLLVLAVGTSIDALIVGVSLSFVQVALLPPVLAIGLVTFALTLAGVYIGDRVGHFFEGKIEILGGLVLIGIGLKILLQHLLGPAV
jgi:putative Mn2+ efflux pump MntP